MKPGDRCPTCPGILIDLDGKAHCARENKWWSDRAPSDGAIYAAASRKNCPDHLMDEAITRALRQDEPAAEVVEPSWKVSEEERQRMAERFRRNGLL